MEGVTIVSHPLVQHKLTLLREKDASTKSFRELLKEIGMLLCYEVTHDLPVSDIEIETPLARMKSPQLAGKKLGAEQKKALQAELERVTDMRNERIQQLYTLTSPVQKPTVEIGLHDAMQLEDVIELAATSARRDMANLFARYRELRAERGAIADQQVRLARAETWLKEHGPAKEH